MSHVHATWAEPQSATEHHPNFSNLADRLRMIDGDEDEPVALEGSFLDPRREPHEDAANPPAPPRQAANDAGPPSPKRKRGGALAFVCLCLLSAGLGAALISTGTLPLPSPDVLLTLITPPAGPAQPTVVTSEPTEVSPAATEAAVSEPGLPIGPVIAPFPAAPEAVVSVPSEISVEPSKEVRLAIAVDPSDAIPARSSIAIHDLPEGATLSAGRPYGARGWTLMPDELGDVRIMVPESAGSSTLRIELLDAAGSVTSAAEARLTVATAPKPSPIVRPGEVMRAQSLIEHGRKMVAVGYVAGARAYFQRAAEAGSAEAASALASTYGAEALKAMHAHGIQADPAQARFWYERAEELGRMVRTN